MAENLEMWKQRLTKAQSDWEEKCSRTDMDHRENLYAGRQQYKSFGLGDTEESCEGEDVVYCNNIVSEHIEAQISVDIPAPKVTPRRKQDEPLARIIEEMLRNERDRMPMEELNDQAERTVLIQGGGLFQTDWDNSVRTHMTVGAIEESFIHPKQLVPQPGVYSGLEDMDYYFLLVPETIEAVKARYDIDLSGEGESEPEIRSADGETAAEDMVTVNFAYYKNDVGGIGRYVWVNNTELEDLADYQARRMTRCRECGAPEPVPGRKIYTGDEPYTWRIGDPCPACGAESWEEGQEDFQRLTQPVVRSDGTVVPGTESASPEQPVIIPYYKPDKYPTVLQKNISVYGRLIGESDATKIESYQDYINRMNRKIIARFFQAGDFISLPPDPSVKLDPETRTLRLKNISDLQYINLYTFTGNLEQELYANTQTYEESRRQIGLTDSYQGRSDTTATTGVAKEFSAAQAAGRMQSKRTMKESAWAKIYELWFRFMLAYADEPRPIVYRESTGETVYARFSKWDFLEKDESGEWFWNDMFLFSCDSASALASDRSRMWQETTELFRSGSFGDPAATETQIEYWRKMEMLHYPGSGETLKNIQERMEREQMAAEETEPLQMSYSGENANVEEKAREAAMQDALDAAANQAAMREIGE